MKKLHLISFFIIQIFIISFAYKSFSQSIDNKKYIISTQFNYGYIMPHYVSLRYLIEKNPYCFELNFGKQTYGKYYWEQLYNYPTNGIGIFYSNLGNPNVLGNVKSIYWFYNKTLSHKKIYQFKLNAQLGLAYLSKPFDPITNYINFAMTTHFNVHFGLSLEANFKLNQNLYFYIASGLNHFSNGAVKKPNLGINMFSFRSGFKYSVGKNKEKIISEKPIFIKNNYFLLTYNIGYTSSYLYTDSKKYFINILRTNYIHNYNPKSSIGIGLDIYYNKALILNFVDKINYNNSDFLYFGIPFYYGKKYGHTSIFINIGINYINKFKTFDNYQRIGMFYNFTKNLYLNMNLQSRLGKAQWIEVGVGIKI